MTMQAKVVVIVARCGRTRRTFGIRLEAKTARQWIADWAFAMKERSASKEGYDRTQISGSFGFDAAYPGCPHCEAQGAYNCACGKVVCWTGQEETATCPWCGAEGQVGGRVEKLSAGVDR